MNLKQMLQNAKNFVCPDHNALPPEWADHIKECSAFTPDIEQFHNIERVLLFNPDPRVNLDNKGITVFTQATYLAYEAENRLVMLPRPNTTEYPTWGKADLKAPASVRGELVFAREYDITQLDKFYTNGVQFERTHIWVHLPYKMDRRSSAVYVRPAKCFAYLGRSKFWFPRLDGGYNTRKLPADPSGIRAITNHVVQMRR